MRKPGTAAAPARARPSVFEAPEAEEGQVEMVDTVDKRGAFHKDNVPKKKAPLVIKAVPNKSWAVLSENQAHPAGPLEDTVRYGLTEYTAPQPTVTELTEKGGEEFPVAGSPNETATGPKVTDESPEVVSPKARARQELLSGPLAPTLTIRRDETEQYHHDVASLPPPTSQQEYEAVPVEAFGAALLRGMGWKGAKGKATPAVAKRPVFLGIGAEPMPEDLAEESGREATQIYSPFVKRDRATGVVVEREGPSPVGKRRRRE